MAIKICAKQGLALSGFEQLGPEVILVDLKSVLFCCCLKKKD